MQSFRSVTVVALLASLATYAACSPKAHDVSSWVDYRDRRDDFSARFPMPPHPDMATNDVHGATYALGGVTLFVASKAIEGDGAPDARAVLTASVAETMAEMQGTIDGSREVVVGGLIGLDVTFRGSIDGAPRIGRLRIICMPEARRFVRALATARDEDDAWVFDPFVESLVPNDRRPPPPPPPPRAPPPIVWVDFESGAYRIKLPAAGTEEHAPIMTLDGARTMDLVIAKDAAHDLVVAAGVIELGAPIVGGEHSIERYLRSCTAEILSGFVWASPGATKNVTLDGGRWARDTSFGGINHAAGSVELGGVARCIVDPAAPHRIYRLVILGRAPLDETFRTRFFGSWQPK